MTDYSFFKAVTTVMPDNVVGNNLTMYNSSPPDLTDYHQQYQIDNNTNHRQQLNNSHQASLINSKHPANQNTRHNPQYSDFGNYHSNNKLPSSSNNFSNSQLNHAQTNTGIVATTTANSSPSFNEAIDDSSADSDDSSSSIPYPFPLPLPADDQISPNSGLTLPQIRRQLNIFCKEQLLEFAAYVMWSTPEAYSIGEAMLEADPSTRRVMVRGLLFGTTDETFQKYFATFGPLENAAIIRHGDGRSQGYGFLIYKNRSSAEQVVNQQHILDGRTITTKLAADARHQCSPPPTGTVDRRKLFIRNIRADITKDVLMEQFAAYGPIEECAIIPTAAGASKGYGFVTFKRARDALKAAQLPFRMINNWIVFVAFSTGKGRSTTTAQQRKNTGINSTCTCCEKLKCEAVKHTSHSEATLSPNKLRPPPPPPVPKPPPEYRRQRHSTTMPPLLSDMKTEEKGQHELESSPRDMRLRHTLLTQDGEGISRGIERLEANLSKSHHYNESFMRRSHDQWSNDSQFGLNGDCPKLDLEHGFYSPVSNHSALLLRGASRATDQDEPRTPRSQFSPCDKISCSPQLPSSTSGMISPRAHHESLSLPSTSATTHPDCLSSPCYEHALFSDSQWSFDESQYSQQQNTVQNLRRFSLPLTPPPPKVSPSHSVISCSTYFPDSSPTRLPLRHDRPHRTIDDVPQLTKSWSSTGQSCSYDYPLSSMPPSQGSTKGTFSNDINQQDYNSSSPLGFPVSDNDLPSLEFLSAYLKGRSLMLLDGTS